MGQNKEQILISKDLLSDMIKAIKHGSNHARWWNCSYTNDLIKRIEKETKST